MESDRKKIKNSESACQKEQILNWKQAFDTEKFWIEGINFGIMTEEY